MNVKVGIAQFAPVVLDTDGCVEKACKIISDASKEGIKLPAFPETWIPIYPVWADMGTFSQWGNAQTKKLHARHFQNSDEVGSPEFKKIGSVKACVLSKSRSEKLVVWFVGNTGCLQRGKFCILRARLFT